MNQKKLKINQTKIIKKRTVIYILDYIWETISTDREKEQEREKERLQQILVWYISTDNKIEQIKINWRLWNR